MTFAKRRSLNSLSCFALADIRGGGGGVGADNLDSHLTGQSGGNAKLSARSFYPPWQSA